MNSVYRSRLTREQVLAYEIGASAWSGSVSWGWAQNLAARYFAWKTRRKFARYEAMLSTAEWLGRNRHDS